MHVEKNPLLSAAISPRSEDPQAMLLRLRALRTSARNVARHPCAVFVRDDLDRAVEALSQALSAVEKSGV
jgi:hypothetical protein